MKPVSPRVPPRTVLVLGACLALGLALFVGGPAARVTAQATPPTATGVEATLHTNVVQWTTTPSVFVVGELRDSNGRALSRAAALADDQGLVVLTFGGRQPALPGRPGQPGAGGASLAPGIAIHLTPAGGQETAVTVPTLSIGADVTANRILGTAPAGSSVSVAATVGGSAVLDAVSADPGGAWAYAVPAPAALAPGDTGRATLQTGEGNRFHATFHVLEAEVTIGARQVSGAATLGTTVTASLTAADGSAKGRASTSIVNDDAWSMAGGRGTAFGGVAAGDVLSVTQESKVPGASFTLQGSVPPLDISINLPAGRVEGQAPAGAALAIELDSPYGDHVVRSAVADGSGRFSADVGDVPDFGRGWTASVFHSIVPGLRVRAVQTMEQVRVGVHRSLVSGVGQPGRAITVTVRSASGTVKGTTMVRVGGAGQFQTTFAGDETIEIGDVVEVEFVAGDPVSVVVAEVTAETDAQADTVRGVAPPGASVRVSQGAGSAQQVVLATVGSDGRYRADFSGKLDLAPPMTGDVVVRLPSGHELFTGWAAVQMTIEIGQPFVSGNGPVGRLVALDLVDPAGTVVASAETQPSGGGGLAGSGGGGRWTAELQDTLGAGVDIRPGDALRALVGDDRFEILVPELSGAAFVADDIVNGHTTAGRAVSLRITRPGTGDAANADVVADANGNFSHSFADTFDVQHNDAVLFSTLEAGHVVNSRVLVPGLRLDLDTATLVGSWRPDAEMVMEMRRGGRTVASGQVRAGDDAVFATLLTDAGGDRVLPQMGDTISVEPLGDLVDVPLEMVVPELTIAWDMDSNEIGGRATPGGSLILTVRDVIERGLAGPQARRSEPTIGADSTYNAAFQPPMNLLPGMEMEALYRLASGHIAIRTRHTALLNVQHGGANVCGFAVPQETVTAIADDVQGREVARGSGRAGYRSQYALVLQRPDGEPLVSDEGTHVSAVLAGDVVSMTLPALSIQVDWQTGQVTGTGPANSAFQMLRPARGCLDTANRFVQRGRTNREGRFIGRMPNLDPGEGFEIAFFTADEHRFYRQVFRSLGQVYVYTDRVTGRAVPQTPVRLVLFDEVGTEKGSAGTVADANGRFRANLTDTTGAPVASVPTDRLQLEASGETPDILVEELRFDWSPGDPIVGTAPAGRPVRVTVGLADGSASFTLTAGTDGVFRFGAEDVPPRSAWGLADIVGVRIVLETPNGHEIVAETGNAPEPPDRPYDIYLPRVTRHS